MGDTVRHRRSEYAASSRPSCHLMPRCVAVSIALVVVKSIFILLCFVLTVSSCATVQKGARRPHMPQPIEAETLDPPQFKVPGDGISVNEEFTVVLQKAPTLPCISIPTDTGDATLLISRRLLEQLVLSGREDPLTARSIKWLLGERANAILQTISESKDAFGCTTAPWPIPIDSIYLLGRLIQSGQLAIMDHKTHVYLPSITVRYFALEAVGGRVSYGYVLSYRTWVR